MADAEPKAHDAAAGAMAALLTLETAHAKHAAGTPGLGEGHRDALNSVTPLALLYGWQIVARALLRLLEMRGVANHDALLAVREILTKPDDAEPQGPANA